MKKLLTRSLCALLAAVLLLGCALPALADDGLYMYVATGNSGKLHLRALPTTESLSLGLFPNGTKVRVQALYTNWAFVQVNGQQGYMLLRCLSGAAPVTPIPAATPAPTENTTLYVRTGNSGKLHLREYASQNARSLGLYPNGTAVLVTARSGGWAFVNVGGVTGYMMLQFLAASSQPAPQPTADPGKVELAYVHTGNSGKLHLREYPTQSARSLGLYPNGTPVYAVNLGNGWSQVVVGGQSGYMMTMFLSSSSYTPDPTPTPVPVPVPVPEGATLMYVATGNSGKLHLRENMSTEAASLGLYPNGTPVYVLVNYGAWAYVNANGKLGYMMTVFLTAAGAPVPATPAPTASPTARPDTATVTHPNNSFVYLRTSKDSNSRTNVLYQVPSGTVVKVVEWGELWSKVVYDSNEGYMVTQYLK